MNMQLDEIAGDAGLVSAPMDRNARARELRADRQQRGECVRGCGQQAGADSDYCRYCEPKALSASAARMKSLRAERRVRGECAFCGKPKSPYRCAECRASDGRPLVGCSPGVNRASPARFHTEGMRHTVEPKWVAEADGRRRRRFRGKARRGAPSRLETDEWDLRAMETEISRARAELHAFYSEENQERPRIQRDSAKRSALGHLELLQRFVCELVARTRKGLR